MNQDDGRTYCVECGQLVAADARFCVNCGKERVVAPSVAAEPKSAATPTLAVPTVAPVVAPRAPGAAPEPVPAAPEPTLDRSSSRVPALLAGLAVGLVLLAGVAFAVRASTDDDAAESTTNTFIAPVPPNPATVPPKTVSGVPTSPPAPRPTFDAVSATTQMRALDAMLDESALARQPINNAVTQIGECREIAAGVDTFARAGTARRALLGRLAALDLSAVSAGERLRGLLATAWQNSATADDAYVAWGNSLANGCDPATSRNDQNFANAHATDDSSTAAKNEFVALWNVAAPSFGLAPRDAGSI
jgi:hypothetical protein